MALLVTALGAFPASAGAGPHGLLTGFTDDEAFGGLGQAERQVALPHVRAAGGSVVRFTVSWTVVAPTAPPDVATARDPAWSGYHWGTVDAAIKDITAAGLQPLPVVYYAPAWAEGPGRPTVSRAAPAGSWRPSAEAYGNFAYAVATRYSGRFPDPSVAGATLPHQPAVGPPRTPL